MATKTVNRISGDKQPVAAPVEKVLIPKPNLRTFEVVLRGTSPLIVHRFSEKARQQIEDKQAKKANKAKAKRDPEFEYLAACYVFPGHEAGKPGCKYGIPATMIKAALVAACRYIDGFPMTKARGAIHVMAEEGNLVELRCKKMQRDDQPVRLAGRGSPLDMRYRPEFLDWWVKPTIKYNADVVSAEQICNLLMIAGFSCGFGELRPGSESGPGGSCGMFTVETAG